MGQTLYAGKSPQLNGTAFLPSDEMTIDWSALPGLVGELTRWGHSVAMRETYLPSAVGALLAVSTAAGPGIRGGFTDRPLYPNLYLGALMPTGTGKADTVSIVRLALEQFAGK